jgi:hypothetical protein
MPQLFERIVEWFVDHASWDLFVELAKNHWKEVPSVALVAIAVAIAWRRYRNGDAPTSVIRFDYLPSSPLSNGWTIGYRDPGPKAKWTSPVDAPMKGSISIQMDPLCAIQLVLAPNETLCERIVYSARYSHTTMIFVRVGLASANGLQTDEKWIKFVVGSGPSYQTPGYEKDEWTLPLVGNALTVGWRRFDISLPDAVGKTWGAQGWVFASLRIIRLRGDLAISPIELY